MARHVRKGDTVIVRSGDFKGMTGEVLRVLTKSDSVVIRGINIHTKHLKPSRLNPQGGVISKELPIHLSKVSPVVDGKAVRVGFRTEPDGSKVRIARKKGVANRVLGKIHGPREKAVG
ncbi:MAG: 50S ribosomal protein L24 [Phycisphaerales bacterium]